MATINVSQVQRLRCYIEPNGSLGTDHTGTLGDFFEIPAIEGSIEAKLEYPMIESKILRQNRDDYATDILGIKKGTLSFSMPFFLPTIRSAASTSPVAIADTAATKLLGAWLGGHALGTSMDADSGCSATVLKTSDHANAAEGCGVAWADASNMMHARRVVKKATTDLTLDQALPTAPTAADIIYRGHDLYLANRATASVTTLQFLFEGADPTYDCVVMRGGQFTTAPSFEFKTGERPMIKFTIEFAAWDHKTSLVTSTAIQTYTQVTENLVSDGAFTVWAIDTAAPATPVALKTSLGANEVSFDFGLSKYIKVTSPGGVGGVAAYVMTGESPKITGKFRMPLESSDVTWKNLRDARTSIAINMQIGSSKINGCILISVPTAEITDWQPVRSNGIVEQEISWSAKLDCMHDTTTTLGTELTNAPFKIYVF